MPGYQWYHLGKCEPPRPYGRGFWLRRLVVVTWYRSHHATTTNWSGAEESVLVDEFASFRLLI